MESTTTTKVELIEAESRMVVARDLGGGGNGEMLVKGYKLSVISSEHLMYSMMSIIIPLYHTHILQIC